MKIAMIGLGSVAMADALTLGRSHEVVVTGPVPDRVEAINAGQYALNDPCLADYLRAHRVNVRATLDTHAALDGAHMVFVSAPLTLDASTGTLNTVELESRLELVVRLLPNVPVVIRSAVPIGFTESQRQVMGGAKLVYVPEFSRDGSALRDLLEARYLIIGDRGKLGAQVAQVLASATWSQHVAVCQMAPSEAEAARHLSVLIEATGPNAETAMTGTEMRAGHDIPSLDDFSLAAPFVRRDGVLSPARAHAVQARIKALAQHLGERGARHVGVYIPMPSTGAQNPKHSLRQRLEAFGLRTYAGHSSDGSLEKFKDECDFVVAHRMTAELMDIPEKVFTRDSFAGVYSI